MHPEQIVGGGDYTYRIEADWAKLPSGWSFKDVAAVAVDRQDRVYVFNRGEHPMLVFDREGNLLNCWGERLFHRAHGLHIGPDETLYCTDDGDHTVRQCTLDGKVLLEIGIPGRASEFMSGEPFNRCTHTALSPDLDIYVSDGYANARVHKFDPNGKLLFSWGECGSDPGQFNIPHNIVSDPDGWIYVADRENHRVQVFDKNGRYETQWNNLHRPCGLYMEGGAHGCCYIGELGPHQPVNMKFPNLGPRL
ncbi:MAG TPA: peptidyl-alpha-hydroxyglycine alpha-amidating lyase family protein, partial [Stellaceae bacterium]